jgi:hypothetical protein
MGKHLSKGIEKAKDEKKQRLVLQRVTDGGAICRHDMDVFSFFF